MTLTSWTRGWAQGALILLLSAGPAAPAAAAPACVRGTIVDAVTGAPLAHVLVSVDGLALDARSDEQGAFEICGMPAGPRRLIVSVVGYILVRRDVTVGRDTAMLTIPLAPGTGTYTETVSVQGEAVEPASRGVPSRRVLGSAELQDLRGVLADDPYRAVQALPGVAATDDFRSEFSVRGLGYRQVGVVLDGVETPALLHVVGGGNERSGSVATINSDILERVSLLSGGYPQRYGGHLGAQLEFETREGSRLRRQLRAAVSGTNASVVAEGPIGHEGRGSWLVSARKSYLDLIISRVVEDHDFAFGFTDVHGKLGWDLTPRQHLQVNVVAGWSNLDRERSGLGANSLSRGSTDSALSSLRWTFTPSSTVIVSQTVSAVSAGFVNRNREAYLLDRGHRSDLTWRGDATVSLGTRWLLEAGGDVQRLTEDRREQRVLGGTGQPEVRDEWDADAWRGSAYAQARVALPRAAAVNAGARIDRWGTIDGSSVSPWLQLEMPLSRSFGLRAGTGGYRQAADLDQVSGVRGGVDLDPERAWQADIGVAHQVSSLVSWEAVVYTRRERDVLRLPDSERRLVDGHVVPESATSQWENALTGSARGVEVLVHRRTPNGLSGWIAYAWGRARYEDDARGESFWSDFDQRHTFNAYAHYRLTDRTSLAVKLRIGSNYPLKGYIEWRDGEYWVSSARNVARLPVYHRLDLRANRTFRVHDTRVTLFAELLNAYDHTNRRLGDPVLASPDGRLRRVTETLIPIVPSAGVLVEF